MQRQEIVGFRICLGMLFDGRDEFEPLQCASVEPEVAITSSVLTHVVKSALPDSEIRCV